TTDPVVNECRNPISPATIALRTSASGRSRPRPTRSSNGLFASRAAYVAVAWSGNCVAPVKRPIDHFHLLLARHPDEIHRVAGDPNRQVGIVLRMRHRVHQRLATEHVD